jgi:hypothetical protein
LLIHATVSDDTPLPRHASRDPRSHLTHCMEEHETGLAPHC